MRSHVALTFSLLALSLPPSSYHWESTQLRIHSRTSFFRQASSASWAGPHLGCLSQVRQKLHIDGLPVPASWHSHGTPARPDQEHHRALPHGPSAVVACHKAHSVIQEILQGGVPCPQLRAHSQQRDKIHAKTWPTPASWREAKSTVCYRKTCLERCGSWHALPVWLTLPLSGLFFPPKAATEWKRPPILTTDDCDTGKAFMARTLRSLPALCGLNDRFRRNMFSRAPPTSLESPQSKSSGVGPSFGGLTRCRYVPETELWCPSCYLKPFWHTHTMQCNLGNGIKASGHAIVKGGNLWACPKP